MPFTVEHFTLLKSWFATEREVVVWAGTRLRHPLDDEQLSRMLADGHEEPPARLCWMAQRAGTLVGHAQLAFDWRNGNATISAVAIAPAERGRGFAKPMLSNVLRRAFSHDSIERVELNVFTFNVAAIRTYERLGFITEGVRRASARVGAERWDVAIMALARPTSGVVCLRSESSQLC